MSLDAMLRSDSTQATNSFIANIVLVPVPLITIPHPPSSRLKLKDVLSSLSLMESDTIALDSMHRSLSVEIARRKGIEPVADLVVTGQVLHPE